MKKYALKYYISCSLGPVGDAGSAGPHGPRGPKGEKGKGVSGVKYVRWGKTNCSRDATLVYSGKGSRLLDLLIVTYRIYCFKLLF